MKFPYWLRIKKGDSVSSKGYFASQILSKSQILSNSQPIRLSDPIEKSDPMTKKTYLVNSSQTVLIRRIGRDTHHLEQPHNLLTVLPHDRVQQHNMILEPNAAPPRARARIRLTLPLRAAPRLIPRALALKAKPLGYHARRARRRHVRPLLLRQIPVVVRPLLELQRSPPLRLLQPLLRRQPLDQLHFRQQLLVLIAAAVVCTVHGLHWHFCTLIGQRASAVLWRFFVCGRSVFLFVSCRSERQLSFFVGLKDGFWPAKSSGSRDQWCEADAGRKRVQKNKNAVWRLGWKTLVCLF